jgi:hypothetical protein
MHADNDVVTFLKIKSQIQWAKFEVDLAYRETSPAQTQNPNYISYYHSLYQFEGANTRKLLYCSLESVCKGKQKKKKKRSMAGMAEMQRRQGGRPFALTARAFPPPPPPPPPPIDREKVHVSFSLSGFF